MVGSRRSTDWGIPRWRGYGSSREAQTIRLCDRFGCTQPGNHPAPKAPDGDERWYFCETHVAEYNRGWNYFVGLTAEEAAEREQKAANEAEGYRASRHHDWGGPGDGSRSREEMRALDILGLEPDAGFDAVRAAWRRLAKAHHPDAKPGDVEAARRFQEIQAAYEVLKANEERRSAA